MFGYVKGRLWTFIPLVVLYFAVVWAGDSMGALRTITSGVRVYGTVTAVARCHNGEGTPDGTVELTVAFRDAHGVARVFREAGCYPYRFGVGHRLTVRYLAADPRRVATQNDLDRLARQVLRLAGLLATAVLCAGALLVTVMSDLLRGGVRGVARRATSAAAVAAGSLIGLGALGLIACFLVYTNSNILADEQLGDSSRTATATARVMRVTSCYYNPGGGDAIVAVLARRGRAAGSGELGPGDDSNGEQPTVSFVDRSGLTQQMELNECDPLYRVGMTLQVTYLLADPTRHYDDGPNSSGPNTWGGNCVFTLEFISLAAIIVALLSSLGRMRANSRARRARPAAGRRA